jgi:hypothetical protein
MILLQRSQNFIQIPWTGVENLDFEILRKFRSLCVILIQIAAVVAEHAVA